MAELSWPLPEELTDEALEAVIYPNTARSKAAERPLPDWAKVHRERKKAGVTLSLLWEEYIEKHPTAAATGAICIAPGGSAKWIR